MSVLVDTNVLLRSIEPRHPMHHLAAHLVQVLRQRGEQLLIVPQNVYEFWVAATRPVAQNGLGLTAQEAEAEVARLKLLFVARNDSAAIFPQWERIVVQHQVIGKSAHD